MRRLIEGGGYLGKYGNLIYFSRGGLDCSDHSVADII